jgi:transposase InsO family protein
MSKRQEGRIRRPRNVERADKAAPDTKRRAKAKARATRSTDGMKEARQRKPMFVEVSLAPSDLVQRAVKNKLPWIKRYLKEGCPRGKLMPFAEEARVAAGLDGEVPPESTLRTWVRRYKQFGIGGLIDSVASGAGKSLVLGEEGEVLLVAAVLGGGQTVEAARAFIVRHSGGKIKPSYNTVRRAVLRLRRDKAHLFAMARNGPVYFRNVFRMAVAQGALPAGYRYEIDSTVADIWVRVPDPKNPGKWVAVRPVLTVIQDTGSRAILAFGFSLAAVDSGIVLGTFRRAVDQACNYPGLVSLGLPVEVAVDRGSEHRGAFLRAMETLGVTVIAGIPNEPQGQAHVERVLGTITSEVFAHQIGYSRTQKRFDPYAPADADAKRSLSSLKYDTYRPEILGEQLLTLPQLEAKVLGWASVYNDRSHQGLPSDSPELRRLIDLAGRYDSLHGANDDSNSDNTSEAA